MGFCNKVSLQNTKRTAAKCENFRNNTCGKNGENYSRKTEENPHPKNSADKLTGICKKKLNAL